MSFSGFTEDDIRKLTGNAKKLTMGMKVKGQTKLNPNNNINKPKEVENAVNLNDIKDISYVKKPEKISITPEVQNDNPIETNEVNMNEKDVSLTSASTLKEATSEVSLSKDEQQKPKISTVKIDLDEFESRQKLIEEQNRKRKELLAKALADRTKQTQEEAQRLNEIQEEFKKLDATISNDVKILRQQIDVASLDYMEAQKKYDKIEKEFLNAKVILFQKLEKKQMLTEHLCTIIEKNEERKADKLKQLLNKLNITNDNIVSEPNEICNENAKIVIEN